MTTNTSPGATSNETSRTAATQPDWASSSLRLRSASGVPTTLSALGPNTFHSERTEIAAVGSTVEVPPATGVLTTPSLMREPPMTVLRRTSRSAQG